VGHGWSCIWTNGQVSQSPRQKRPALASAEQSFRNLNVHSPKCYRTTLGQRVKGAIASPRSSPAPALATRVVGLVAPPSTEPARTTSPAREFSELALAPRHCDAHSSPALPFWLRLLPFSLRVTVRSRNRQNKRGILTAWAAPAGPRHKYLQWRRNSSLQWSRRIGHGNRTQLGRRCCCWYPTRAWHTCRLNAETSWRIGCSDGMRPSVQSVAND
jgi:hypothetical protein